MISNPPLGARVITRSGKSGILEQLEGDRVVVRIADGLRRIPLSVVERWEPPDSSTPQLGDRIRLRGTQIVYTLIEVYEVNQGWDNGVPFVEQWARLQDLKGKIARWKITQLEREQDFRLIYGGIP